MMKRAIKIVLLASTLWFQCAAQAGQLTLYTNVNFDGRGVTVRDAVPDLSQIGFNDRASSMVIDAGRWQVCVDAGFRGHCEVFERGEYAHIAGFNDLISSVREVGGPGRDRRRGADGRDNDGRDNDGRHGGGDRTWRSEQDLRGSDPGWRGDDASRRSYGSVLLYSMPNFGGAHLTLESDIRSLDVFDFNDQAGSIVVQGGQWELCVHADFGGQCKLYGPGRYAWLGSMNHQISSVRRVR
ncbi:MAG: hypothetical protein ACI83P_000922 [Janthinobacterium sp.]|jgi:hypothetical protein